MNENWRLLDQADFVKASEPYFKYEIDSWTIHEAVCLMERLNPNQTPTLHLGMNGAKDEFGNIIDSRQLRAVFKAIVNSSGNPTDQDSIGFGKLQVLNPFLQDEDTNKIRVSPRDFVAWALKYLPTSCGYLEACETEYQLRKIADGKIGKLTKDQWKALGQKGKRHLSKLVLWSAFVNSPQLLDESAHKLASILHKKMKRDVGHSY